MCAAINPKFQNNIQQTSSSCFFVYSTCGGLMLLVLLFANGKHVGEGWLISPRPPVGLLLPLLLAYTSSGRCASMTHWWVIQGVITDAFQVYYPLLGGHTRAERRQKLLLRAVISHAFLLTNNYRDFTIKVCLNHYSFIGWSLHFEIAFAMIYRKTILVDKSVDAASCCRVITYYLCAYKPLLIFKRYCFASYS